MYARYIYIVTQDLRKTNTIAMFVSVTRVFISKQDPPLKNIQIHIEINKVFLIDIYARS